MAILEQILEMDEEDQERAFSKSVVHDFFRQAEICFADMKVALEQGNLSKLSWLGNFLRDSSVSIGLTKVNDCCVKIQSMGQRRNEDDSADEPDEKKCLTGIKAMLEKAELECATSALILKEFFSDELEANQ
ncbi:hypothetical protein WAI453_006468 [Rhynchosporium graminicola]|uniref:Related to multistep phosphorelay regulator 1 n=1 Tax=Rhynchosporium secalis TaxID=38038 RepID=A0A1E1MUV4_RHYSE|nr:related to multistep phosphorelay regulator 1 [Rhynchosporium secalis]